MKTKILLLSLVFGSSLAFASDFPEVNDYLKVLAHFEKKPTTASLETVYAAGLRAAKVLEAKIEALEGEKFQKLEKEMLGFNMGREESISVSPKFYFFEKLAKKSPHKADLTFFENQRALHENGSSLQDYYSFVTDVTACVDFDGKALFDAYRRWTSYKATYPKNYVAEVTKEIAEVEKALLSDCVCGKKDSYEKKISQFLKIYPNLPIAEKIKNKTKKIRFECAPT